MCLMALAASLVFLKWTLKWEPFALAAKKKESLCHENLWHNMGTYIQKADAGKKTITKRS